MMNDSLPLMKTLRDPPYARQSAIGRRAAEVDLRCTFMRGFYG